MPAVRVWILLFQFMIIIRYAWPENVAMVPLVPFFVMATLVVLSVSAVTYAPLFLMMEPSFGHVMVKAKPFGCALRSLDPALS